MPSVYVSIGSNVDPERNVTLASSELVRLFPDTRFSSWYWNKAVGFEGDDFLNCVAGFTTDLRVHAIVEQLHAIEALCGRPREAPRWAPRTMDIDILLYGDLVYDEPKLRLPRPDLLRRAYMLGPLAELAPAVWHPTATRSIAELWREFHQSSHLMRRVNAPSCE